VLLLPLDKRLRNDAVDALRETARAARPTFADLPPDAIRQGSPQLQRAARSLRRQTGAEVTVVAPNGQVLAATDLDPGERFTDASAAVRSDTTETDVVEREGQSQGKVAVPVDADGKRFALVLRRPLEAVTVAGDAVRQGMLVAAIAALVAALVVGVLVARRLVRRLDRLRDSALRVAEIGPAAEVRPDDARDEVGDLTRAFAAMQQHLREQEQARKTFVATASHELRTPLASLELMLNLLVDDLDSAHPDVADAREQAARARDHTDRLGKLAAGLLDLSRLDAGLPSRSELVEVGEICRAVMAEFEPRVADGPELVLDAPETCWAIADPGAVAQILRILLDNAVRFSPADEPVEVRLRLEDGAPELSVHDHGPGVPADETALIFERFQRGRDAGREAGFGLGLAIARELAARMGARLELAPGDGGARFVVTLEPAPSASLETA
jgi:signal transduction histidine kinase